MDIELKSMYKFYDYILLPGTGEIDDDGQARVDPKVKAFANEVEPNTLNVFGHMMVNKCNWGLYGVLRPKQLDNKLGLFQYKWSLSRAPDTNLISVSLYMLREFAESKPGSNIALMVPESVEDDMYGKPDNVVLEVI